MHPIPLSVGEAAGTRLQTLENGRRGAAAMSSMNVDFRGERSGDAKIAADGRHVSFWIRELPFSLVLILTLAGNEW